MINQLTVIADDEMWEGPVGDSVRYYYESAFPLMPQPEPIFDIRHFNYDQIAASNLRRELRAYLILADLSDTSSNVTQLVKKDLKNNFNKEGDKYNAKIGYNRWATDQMVIYLFQENKESLADAVATSFKRLRDKIYEHDAEMIAATTYAMGENLKVQRRIEEKYGVRMKISNDYVVATDDDKAMWLRRLDDDHLTNLILYKKPYRSADQLKKEEMITLRDSLGRYIVSTSAENSYMRTATEHLPTLVESFTMDDHFVQQLKGVWEMEGDFYGGPYFFYGILSPDQREVFYVDAFILAPGEEKKKEMQYLDHMVRSARFRP